MSLKALLLDQHNMFYCEVSHCKLPINGLSLQMTEKINFNKFNIIKLYIYQVVFVFDRKTKQKKNVYLEKGVVLNNMSPIFCQLYDTIYAHTNEPTFKHQR